MTSGELGRRLAVAAVGVPAVVALLYMGGWFIAVPVAALAALGARELFGMARARGVRPFGPPGMVAAGVLVLLAALLPSWAAFSPWALGVVGVLLMGCLAATLWRRRADQAPLGGAAVTVGGALYAGLPMAVVPLLHDLPRTAGWGGEPLSPWAGMFAVAFPVAATWVGDSAAYFVGSAFGRTKLAPSISPGKSRAGAVGGLAGAGAATAVWYFLAMPFLPHFPLSLIASVGVGVLLGVAAQVGDLVESLLKREAGIKDSGSLFPGHGGVLDRLDALTFSLPVAYALLAVAEALR